MGGVNNGAEPYLMAWAWPDSPLSRGPSQAGPKLRLSG